MKKPLSYLLIGMREVTLFFAAGLSVLADALDDLNDRLKT